MKKISVVIPMYYEEEVVKECYIRTKVVLNEDNNWTYTWENLDKYSGGNLIEYSVEENEIANSMGISRSYVSRIETKAIGKLSDEFKE